MNQHDFIFPVIGGYLQGKRFQLRQVIGTAFYIKNGYYITAAHVIEAAKQNHKSISIGFLNSDSGIYGSEIVTCESCEEHDIALIRSEQRDENRAYRWSTTPMKAGASVRSFGFPFGLDHSNIVNRFFKGYVVSHGKLVDHGANWLYELSFPCMRGLSGSFLLDEANEQVRGIIVGTGSAYIELYKTTEQDGQSLYVHSETMSLGIAYTVQNYLDLRFDLLDSTLREYLKREDLLR